MDSYNSMSAALYKPQMPSFFLSLAPATSGMARPVMGDVPRPPVRRSSSLSSDSSVKSSSYRVLKLAPVHLGEHANDHKEDWHEVTDEE